MAEHSAGTPALLCNPNHMPPLFQAVLLGIQHVKAMFVSNVMPSIIVTDAAGFGFGAHFPGFPVFIHIIQISMLFAGVAILLQAIGANVLISCSYVPKISGVIVLFRMVCTAETTILPNLVLPQVLPGENAKIDQAACRAMGMACARTRDNQGRGTRPGALFPPLARLHRNA